MPDRQGRPSRWSWRLGQLFGISIRVHITLIALLAWLAIAAPFGGAGLQEALAQWLLVVAVFGCIVIHELAHALVARRFGCPTREILLLPIGGIAQVERMPARPAQELLVAVVGPTTNVVIALILGVVIVLTGWTMDPDQPTFAARLLVPLFWSNVALAAFNLLPAFPMDGGRVLRASLTSRFGRVRATRIASKVGKVLAVVFVIVGVTAGAIMLALIGLFVWFAAEHESATTTLSSVLAHATVADAMDRSPHVVDAATPLDEAAHEMIADGHHELAVIEDGRVTGVITAGDVAELMASSQPHGAVGTAMHRDVPIVSPMMALDAVLEPLERRGVVLVGEGDVIIGVLSSDQVAMFAAFHSAATAA